jgi:hypothetical protein
MTPAAPAAIARGNAMLAPRHLEFTARDWRPVERNTLRGFVTLVLPSSMGLRECSYHVQGSRRWVGLPGRPQLEPDGSHRVDPTTGKKAYVPVVEIYEKVARERFQRAALAAIDRLFEERRP